MVNSQMPPMAVTVAQTISQDGPSSAGEALNGHRSEH
jgi:hypothetical protein